MELAPEGPGGNSLKRQVRIPEFRGLKLSCLPKNVFASEIFQKPGPCPSLSLLPSWLTQSSPLSSTTWTSNSYSLSLIKPQSKLHIKSQLNEKGKS